MFAPLALAMPGLLAVARRRIGLPVKTLIIEVVQYAGTLLAGGLLALAVIGLVSPELRAVLTGGGDLGGVPRDMVVARLIGRLADPWTPLLLAAMLAGAMVLALASRQPAPDAAPADSDNPDALSERVTRVLLHPDSFALALLACGAAVTLAIEFFFIKDFFGWRLNSVFKFWYQAWTLWAVMGAYALMRLFSTRSVLAKLYGVGIAVLACAGLLFPIMAVPSKIAFSAGFTPKATLDGSAYLGQVNGSDLAAINWLNSHVSGIPGVLETPHDGSYNYKGRISAFTGLPAAIGWKFHEYQWRGSMTEQDRRWPLIDALYRTTTPAEARHLMNQLGLVYVVIGNVEREAGYPEDGLAKFGQMCDRVFESGSTQVFRCD
jgi:uncharacterized membrane protein